MAFIIFTCDKEIPNKTGKLGNITIVPYIFLQTLMRIYIFVSTESCFAELFDTDINSH